MMPSQDTAEACRRKAVVEDSAEMAYRIVFGDRILRNGGTSMKGQCSYVPAEQALKAM